MVSINFPQCLVFCVKTMKLHNVSRVHILLDQVVWNVFVTICTIFYATFSANVWAGVKSDKYKVCRLDGFGAFSSSSFHFFCGQGMDGLEVSSAKLEPEGCRLIFRLFHSERQKCWQLMIKCTRTENAGLLSWQLAAAFCLAAKILFTTNSFLQKPNQAVQANKSSQW